MPDTATPAKSPAELREERAAAAVRILAEGLYHRSGPLEVDGRIDAEALADTLENYRQGRYAATGPELALAELAGAVYFAGSFVELAKLPAELELERDAAQLAARALSVLLVGVDPRELAGQALYWTDENTTVGVLVNLRQLGRAYGAPRA